MVFSTDTLDLYHELTELGEQKYRKLLIDIALEGVSPAKFFECIKDSEENESTAH